MADFSGMDQKEYILGSDELELNRLRRQHELWKEELLRLWRQSAFRAGGSYLDLGCGPGFTTRDFARWLGPNSEITAIDASEKFLNFLKAQPHEAGMAKIETHRTFLEQLQLPRTDFAGAFCRWLMIFVPKPADAIRAVHRHLRPGGQFVLQEYVAYDTMKLCPHRESMTDVVSAIFKSWRDEGGDPNRGEILPSLLEQNGFRVTSIEPICRSIRPTDPLWEWPTTFYKIFVPTLVAKKYLTQTQADQFFKDLQEAEKTPGHFMIAPTLVNICAEKI